MWKDWVTPSDNSSDRVNKRLKLECTVRICYQYTIYRRPLAAYVYKSRMRLVQESVLCTYSLKSVEGGVCIRVNGMVLSNVRGWYWVVFARHVATGDALAAAHMHDM